MVPEPAARRYECLLSDLRALQDDTTVVSLDDRVVAGTFYAYNRLPHFEMSRCRACKCFDW
jgi:hypothetical protein